MRKFICIILLLLSAIYSAESAAPFYVVDGKMGVASTDLPSADEIERTTILNPEEAVYIYGERASGGAIIVTTKKYASEHYVQSKKKRNVNSGIIKLIGTLLAIILVLLSKPLRKLTKRIAKKRGVQRKYDTGIFDSEGVRFSASERIENYFPIAFFLIIVAFIGWLLVRLTCSGAFHGDNKGVYVFIFSLFTFLAGFLVFSAMAYSKVLKSFLIVDEKGIRGVYADRIGLRQVLNDVDIRWEQVSKAQMMSPITIAFFKKGLKLPEHFEDFAELAEVDGIEQGTSLVELNGLPANKVRDAVNFFYARYQSQHPNELSDSKKKSYLLAPQGEEDNLYQWIMIILLILIGFIVGILAA